MTVRYARSEEAEILWGLRNRALGVSLDIENYCALR